MSEPKGPTHKFSSADSQAHEKSGAPPTAESNATLDPSMPSSTDADPSTTEVKAIGPYLLLKKLGEGGMGVVWLAQQTAPIRRLVALKLIRSSFYDDSLLQRFRSEQQTLAVMSHPAIAKVFDAGATPDGQPYFAMEYVDGAPITQYCDHKRMKIRERLQLFFKACEGVQHAHQKAIIHRDLKPSNILVAEVDGQPVPRIIDFGIAKAISSQPAHEQTMFTQAGAFVGTPGYMSPEQADTSILDVDTRTDVYSLGAVLYVLLTGTLPFVAEGEKKKRIDEVLRQVREEDPPSPSAKVSTEKKTGPASAESRGLETKQLVKLLRGDLDWITMKALERDRARRYGTPSELAADLQRYLENSPVLARPASAGYRLKKYVQRHRVGVGVAAGAAALLVAFAVAQAVQLQRITRERDRANRITDFMTRMFQVSDPSEARGSTITAKEILDKASGSIDRELTKDPELQAQMMQTMGTVYRNLGLYPRAETLGQRSLQIRRDTLGPEARDTLGAAMNLATTYAAEGHYSEAEKIYRQALETARKRLGPTDSLTLTILGNLGPVLMYLGRYLEAEQFDRQSLELRRRVSGAQDPETLRSVDNLASALQYEGRYPEAEKLQREVLDISRTTLGADHPLTITRLNNLAITLHDEGHDAEAEKFAREVLDLRRRVLGADHPHTVMAINNLSMVLQAEGRYPEAEKLYREALDISTRTLGPDHPSTILWMINLTGVLEQEGKFAEAEKYGRETVERNRRVLGPEHPNTTMAMANLASVLLEENKLDEAEKLDRETLETNRRILGPDHPNTGEAYYSLGCLEAHRGKPDEAFSLIREAVDHGLRPEVRLAIAQDNDLKPLRGDKRFDELVQYAKQHAKPPKAQ
jgi:serine/threonine protein kinase